MLRGYYTALLMRLGVVWSNHGLCTEPTWIQNLIEQVQTAHLTAECAKGSSHAALLAR